MRWTWKARLKKLVNQWGLLYQFKSQEENKERVWWKWTALMWQVANRGKRAWSKQRYEKTKKVSVNGRGKTDSNFNFSGEIIYPVKISNSLTILNFGEIEFVNPAFHSQQNLFPVGYKAERKHRSARFQGQETIYTCEILNHNGRPVYRVIAKDDPENVLIKDKPTACWSEIVKKVNDLAIQKRQG